MILSMSTNNFGALSLPEAMGKVKRIGIDTIEVHHVHMREIVRHWKEAVKALDEFGMTVHSVHSTVMDRNFPDKSDLGFASKYRDYYSELFEYGRRLGASIYVEHLDKFPEKTSLSKFEYDKEKVIMNCRLLAELAAEYELVLAMENSAGKSLVSTPQQFEDIIKGVNYNNFKVNLDINHASGNKVSTREFTQILGEDIVNVHIAGSNVEESVTALAEIGYASAIVIELEEKELRKAFERVMAALTRSGFEVGGLNPVEVPVLRGRA